MSTKKNLAINSKKYRKRNKFGTKKHRSSTRKFRGGLFGSKKGKEVIYIKIDKDAFEEYKANPSTETTNILNNIMYSEGIEGKMPNTFKTILTESISPSSSSQNIKNVNIENTTINPIHDREASVEQKLNQFQLEGDNKTKLGDAIIIQKQIHSFINVNKISNNDIKEKLTKLNKYIDDQYTLLIEEVKPILDNIDLLNQSIDPDKNSILKIFNNYGIEKSIIKDVLIKIKSKISDSEKKRLNQLGIK